MDLELIPTFLNKARKCAMQLMANAAYIQNELSNVSLPDHLHSQVAAVCESLISTKHDVFTELFELSDAIANGSDGQILESKCRRIVNWLSEPLVETQELIRVLEEAAAADPSCSLGRLLVVESVITMILAFNEVTKVFGCAIRTAGTEKTNPTAGGNVCI